MSQSVLEPPNLSSLEALLDAGQVALAERTALEWIAKARGSDAKVVPALTAHGRVLTVLSRYKEAQDILLEALALSENAKIATEDLAQLYKATGVAFGNSGVLDEALRYYEMAVQTSPNKATRLICQSYIGLVQGNLHSWTEAHAILENAAREAIGVLEPAQLLRLRSSVLHSRMRSLENQVPQPTSLLLEIQAAFIELHAEQNALGLKDAQVSLLRSLAKINLMLEDSKSAELYVQEAIRLSREINNPQATMGALHLLAQIKNHFSNSHVALEHLLEALELTEVTGSKGYVSHVHLELSKIYEQFGDHQKALYHHQQYHHIDAEKRSQTATTRANALTARLRLERAELRATLEQERAEELAALNTKLEELAHTDMLTGLANRRSLFESLGRMVEQAKRHGLVFSVAMIDIDHFKHINDTYSHAVGDLVLAEVASILKGQARAADVVARYGGEEFAVLLSGVRGEEALRACERIRQAVERHDWVQVHSGLARVKMTVSIGLCDQALENPEAWLNQADAALYRAKNAGRNQIQTATL